MGSSDRLFNRQRTVHQILGAGFVAEVILWRQRNVSLGVLVMALLVFERFGYTLLSLTSSVLLLLITILFVWSKAASLLNRPAPPLPDVYLTEELVVELGELVRIHTNALIRVFRNVALGKDSRLFLKVATCLLLISVVGGLTDIVSLCYICLLVLLTIPALYERYEDQIDGCLMLVYRSVRQVYNKISRIPCSCMLTDLQTSSVIPLQAFLFF